MLILNPFFSIVYSTFSNHWNCYYFFSKPYG